MEQLGSQWTDFDETWYLSFFLKKSVQKIKVSLKSEKNNGYFTWRLFTFITISRWIILRIRNVSSTSCRENQNTHFMFSDFFQKILPFVIMSINMVEPERPQMTICGALHAGLVRQHAPSTHSHPLTHTNTHTQTEICNTYCFPTATLISRTCLSVTVCSSVRSSSQQVNLTVGNFVSQLVMSFSHRKFERLHF